MQWTLKNSAFFIFIFLTLILILSCNKSLKHAVTKGSSLPFYIKCEHLEHSPGNGIDSQVGTIKCDEYTLQYDYGRYSNSKPLSLYESFSKKFYAFHYSKFFEAIYVEEKLREPLKDSISIIEVVNQRYDGRYIVDCTDCTGSAKISFAKNEFLYAFNPNKSVLENEKNYTLEVEKVEKGYYKKTYYSHNDDSHGVYLAPVGNFAKSRMKDKLSVSVDTAITDKLQQILHSIQLK